MTGVLTTVDARIVPIDTGSTPRATRAQFGFREREAATQHDLHPSRNAKAST